MTRVGGSFPRYVLGIDYDGTLRYYSDIDIATSELNADGKITSWGQLQLQAKVGSIGGHQNISLTIEDADLSLVDDFTDWPGIQTRSCYIYMFYDPAPTGGGWADRITLFKGVIGPGVKFDEKTATWNITLVDIGKKQNPDIGQVYSKQVFDSMICSKCGGDGAIIPIVHGDPVNGVHGCAIERPGRGTICEVPPDYYGNQYTLWPWMLWFKLCQDVMWQFNPGEQCLFLGSGGGKICGNLHANGLFEIYDFENFSHLSWDAGSQRNAQTQWVATGRGSFFIVDGMRYLTLPKSAFYDWTNGGAGYQNRITIATYCGGSWRTWSASLWAAVSASHVAFVMSAPVGAAYDVCTNNNFEFVAYHGQGLYGTNIGTPVLGGDPWTYIFNFLPSESVDRLYAPRADHWADMRVNDVVPASLYTVNTNNKSYNLQLGRAAADEGVTTVTFHGWIEWFLGVWGTGGGAPGVIQWGWWWWEVPNYE